MAQCGCKLTSTGFQVCAGCKVHGKSYQDDDKKKRPTERPERKRKQRGFRLSKVATVIKDGTVYYEV